MKSKTRMALDEILTRHPDWELAVLDWQLPNEFSTMSGPWLLVGLADEEGERVKSYAVWKQTGAIHDFDGFIVSDDAVWEPESRADDFNA